MSDTLSEALVLFLSMDIQGSIQMFFISHLISFSPFIFVSTNKKRSHIMKHLGLSTCVLCFEGTSFISKKRLELPKYVIFPNRRLVLRYEHHVRSVKQLYFQELYTPHRCRTHYTFKKRREFPRNILYFLETSCTSKQHRVCVDVASFTFEEYVVPSRSNLNTQEGQRTYQKHLVL